jgi:hypothetical protein
MSPEQLTAWIQAAAILIQVGNAGVEDVKGWISAAHPTLTPEETAAAFVALENDSTVRAAIAAADAGGTV